MNPMEERLILLLALGHYTLLIFVAINCNADLAYAKQDSAKSSPRDQPQHI
jgi:hypothetical protein